MTIDSWMIEDLDRLRRERERQDRPQLQIELPVRVDEQPADEPDSRGPVVIQIWGA
jgi:hypothetical protein